MRWVLLALSIALCASARANAVMGYALESYDFTAWWVYVASTVLFEAWAMAKAGGYRPLVALGISVLANLVTAFGCTNCFGVFLHGSGADPNPLAELVVAFTVFGVVSGLIESIVWRMFVKRAKNNYGDNQLLKDCVRVHLIWVPVSVFIMLVPSRPYPYVESRALMARRWPTLTVLRQSVGLRTGTYRTLQQGIEDLASRAEVAVPAKTISVLGFVPSYDRFSMTDTRRLPYDWNPRASNIDLMSDGEHDLWLARAKVYGGCSGYLLSVDNTVRYTSDCRLLGIK